jgi:outer membrane protein insertion porin family
MLARLSSGDLPALEHAILIDGNTLVEEATIRARIQSREGAAFDPEQITRDVRSIYELGFFQDIQVDAEGFEGGLQVTFNVVEKPIVRSIAFEGTDKVSEKDIRDKLDFAARSVYSAETTALIVRQIKEIYREKGFYNVEIQPKTEPVGKGAVKLLLVIVEGEKYRVASIRFEGNEAFTDNQLRKVIETKKRNLFSLLTGSGRLVDEVLEEDRQRVLNYYQDHGYLEARVANPQVVVRKKEKELLIVIPLTEGDQYRLGKLDLSGDDLIPLEDIKEIFESREGEIFRRSTFSGDLFTLNKLYTERGYAYVKVDYASRLNPEQRIIDVIIEVKKGNQARIGTIVITGNIATRDKVIRRNISFKEGDLFNSADLRKSRRTVMNLGFFESVDLIPRPRGDDFIDIDIELKEKLTGAFSLGFGYSSEEQLSGQIRVAESNLFGRGQSLQLMAEYGSIRKSYSISFGEPAVWDSRFSFGFKIYDTMKEYDEYDRESLGGHLTFGRSIGEFYRGYLSFKHETVDVSDVAEDAGLIIRDQEGKATTNSIALTFTRDSRDNYFNPTRGNRTILYGEYAGGFLGGDNYFTKFTAESGQYFPLWWKLVFMTKVRLGSIEGFDGRITPIYERFFVGGINSVRGFESRSIGPKDINGDPIGGNRELVFNNEIIVPLSPEEGLNLVVFFDAGNTWLKEQNIDITDLRTGAGLGIRWLSPMGPFRLEWGWNLKPRGDEPGGDWAFAVGAFF